jgi:hypothetical protein
MNDINPRDELVRDYLRRLVEALRSSWSRSPCR